MYELSRVLLRSVGPEAARYENVLLDLSGAGEPVAGQQQTALFAAGEPVRRPSPATVLFLENGGGKSVLIKLIFSVVLPGRRHVPGTTSTHALDDFVLDRDVAHVVLEWTHAKSGRKLVTGKVSQWKDGRKSSDPQKLAECWYHFRPTARSGLENLPITYDGKYRSLSSYCEEMLAADRAEPELEYQSSRVQSEWSSWLGDLGLDPELFKYQRKMNADEGDAADAFAFGSDAAFVTFLLRAVLPAGPPKDLADVLDSYARKLADRGNLELEQSFVEGALELLGPLAEAKDGVSKSLERARHARGELDRFVSGVRTRAERESAVAAQRATELGELRRLRRDRESEHARLTGIVTELKRLVARLRLDRVRDEHGEAEARHLAATRMAKAWQTVPAVLRHLEAASHVTRLKQHVSKTEEAARPALEARDDAARAFAGGLHRVRAQLLARSVEEEERARESSGLVEEAQAEQNAAVGEAAVHDAEAGAMAGRAAEVIQEIEEAVRAGRLPTGATAAEAARRAVGVYEENVDALRRLEDEAASVDTAYDLAVEERQSARTALVSARHSHDAVGRERDAVHARMASLADALRASGLFVGEAEELEAEADSLVGRIGSICESVETSRLDIRVTDAGNQRARMALESTELLPPAPEVSKACELLEERDIRAWPGWQYLAFVPGQEQRRALLQQAPQLVTGILVNDPRQVDHAREVLASAELWPTGYVAVGTTQSLKPTEEQPSTEADFFLPPHPALYDKRAADSERVALVERHTEHQRRLGELDETLRTHTALRARLVAWHQECPPGTLARLQDLLDERKEGLAAAEEAAERLGESCRLLAEQRQALRERVPEQRQRMAVLKEHADDLRGLAKREARIPEWQRAAEHAKEAAGAQRQAALVAGDAAAGHREHVAAHRREADRLKAAGDRVNEEIADLPGGSVVAAEESGTGLPIEVLRRSYRAAQEEHARVAVGASLIADLRQAEQAERAVARELTDVPDQDKDVARQLLNGPHGSDSASRQAASTQAESLVRECHNRVGELSRRFADCRRELQSFASPEKDLDLTPYTRPRSLDHGTASITAAEKARNEAEAALGQARRESEEAQERSEEAGRSAKDFASLVGVFGEPQGRTEGGQEFEGSAAAARQQHDQLNRANQDTRREVEEAEARERDFADRLLAHAAQPTFEALGSPSRRVMLTTSRVDLAYHAAGWADDLRPRLRTLRGDLETIGRNRNAIVGQLRRQVEEALGTLKRAERFSLLPEGLGDWSGQTFLRIHFPQIEEAALLDRLGQVVDSRAASEVREPDTKRDGMTFLLKGVAAAVEPKGFRVTILKPDQVLGTQRVPVSDLKDVFSGGQVLTAAIVLYCTMAGLRANDRGRVGSRYSGVLFLDNPIGRASAAYLLRLQQFVARALGVQLIYTTGIFDTSALDFFPMVIRMRNDADLRARRKYLSVDAEFGSRLDASLGEGPGDHISAARYFIRGGEEDDAGHASSGE